MSPAGNGTKNRIEPQPQPHQRHMRWPQLINSLNASVERETGRGRKGGRETERTRINEGYATGTGLDRTERYAHEIQYLFFVLFSLRDVALYALSLSLSFSLLFSLFFGSCYYWCCLVSLFSFCLLWFLLLLLLLQGFSAVLFKYLLPCTERNIWVNFRTILYVLIYIYQIWVNSVFI